MSYNKPRVVFMGTPEIAVKSLKNIIENGYDVIAVVTTPDKPAGRGRKIQRSAVKDFALERNLNILQPDSLKENDFVDELKSLNPDVQVVVAFRILPQSVWSIPEKGTFNLHASLLPQYRGAAPINRVIMNGESKTGVTTFFIDKNIDTGSIIDYREVSIGERETAGELHDRLMKIGADLVVSTLDMIAKDRVRSISQFDLYDPEKTKLKPAPKIFREDCEINWEKDTMEVYNHIRGLDPFPGAFSEIELTESNKLLVKIFECEPEFDDLELKPGTIHTNKKDLLKIGCKNGIINIKVIQPSGKRKMKIDEFLRGLRL